MREKDKYPDVKEILNLSEQDFDELFDEGNQKINETFPAMSDEDRNEYMSVAKLLSNKDGLDLFDEKGDLLIDSNPEELLEASHKIKI